MTRKANPRMRKWKDLKYGRCMKNPDGMISSREKPVGSISVMATRANVISRTSRLPVTGGEPSNFYC